MSTNGQLVFTDVDKITFKGVGNTSNAVVDTVTGKIGVGIDSPDANLHVLGNSYVSTNLELGGTLIMGTVNVEAQHSLEAITATGNTTPVTVEFQNADTSLVASGNVEVAKELTVTGNATVSSNLTVSGNATVSSNLTVSGNATVSSNLTVSGDANGLTTFGPVAGMGFEDSGVSFCGIKVGEKGTSPYSRTALSVEDNGNTILHVDGHNQRVGIGTVSPGQKLSIYTGSTSTPALSFDRYSTDNYRTDIYQNTNGPDFRVGHGSHTPESILYLKRISDGSKEVNITGTLIASAVRTHYNTYGFDSAWRTLIGTSAYDCGIGHLVHSTGHQYAVFWFAHAGNGTGYTGWIKNGGYTNIAYSGSNIKVQGPGGVTRGYVQFLNNS